MLNRLKTNQNLISPLISYVLDTEQIHRWVKVMIWHGVVHRMH